MKLNDDDVSVMRFNYLLMLEISNQIFAVLG